MSARVVRRHVLQQIPGDRLAVYVVWGPMLGDEIEADAKPATRNLPDPRVTNFWTPTHALATALEQPLGLHDTRAWDTFLLFAPGTRWGEAPPPPDFYMHVNKPLPPERRLNGDKLAEEVRKLLAAPLHQ
jgi:hypothetical protein